MPVLVTMKRKAVAGPRRLEMTAHSASLAGRPTAPRRFNSLMLRRIGAAQHGGFRHSALAPERPSGLAVSGPIRREWMELP